MLVHKTWNVLQILQKQKSPIPFSINTWKKSNAYATRNVDNIPF